jgi:ribosomal protein S18 acetylase RimI-like enzyme
VSTAIQAIPGEPPIGTTVTLRVATPVGPISVVGELVAVDDTFWTVRRRDGSRTLVEIARIEARRVVPPGRAARATTTEVEQVAVLGWRALETARLGEWLLRASAGFTMRANSTLAIGEPPSDLGAAIEAVHAWYGERSLPTTIQLVDGASPAELAPALADRGWQLSPGVHVMTGEIAHAIRALPPGPAVEVRLDDEPDDPWIGCYARVGNAVTDTARRLLTNHPNAIFASVREGDEVLAIARCAVDHKWAGLFAVEVMPEHRRRGLGAIVSVAALREAASRGARQTYLQASIDNTAAVGLYRRLTMAVHHDYRYYSLSVS